MEASSLLLLILAISTSSFLFEQLLDYINLKAQRKDLPADIAAFYDREQYERSLDYLQAQTRFGFLTAGVGFVFAFLMISMGGFGWIDALLRNYISTPIPLALVFFGAIALGSDLISLPFQCYGTFVLEERFGFNKTTPSTFIKDKLKGYGVTIVLGGGLITLLLFLIGLIGPLFWIWFGVISAILVLFINMFYTTLLLPIFNKLTPLPDGDLKSAIQEFAARIEFPLNNIYVMDGSKRSAKANAFFSGIGKKKTIVLYDTLIEKHTVPELVAVLAHEVGHYKKKHILQGYVLSIIQIFFTLWILSLMVFNQNLSLALGATQWGIHLNLVAFGILYAPISGITSLFMSAHSRKNEFEADAYAREHYSGEALSDALKKLSVDSLSNLYPHPLYVFFHYSHPPLLKRLEAIRS